MADDKIKQKKGGSGTSISFDKDATVSAGDRIVVVLNTEGKHKVKAPDEWTEHERHVFSKIATDDEPDSYLFDWKNLSRYNASLFVFPAE